METNPRRRSADIQTCQTTYGKTILLSIGGATYTEGGFSSSSAAAASADADLIFYDIASGPPVRPFAPNPWKVRYALNLKGARFVTQWVDLADVAAVRQGLGMAPSRYHASGEPFPTQPIVQDARAPATVAGDSFDIAVFLDARYPATAAAAPASPPRRVASAPTSPTRRVASAPACALWRAASAPWRAAFAA